MKWATPAQLDEQLTLFEKEEARLSDVLAVDAQLIEAATRWGSPVLLARARHIIAKALLRGGDTNRSLELAEQALELFTPLEYPEYRGSTLNTLGILARRRGDYAGALDYFNSALELARHANALHLCASIHNGIGCTYMENLSQHDEAAAHFHKILDLQHEHDLDLPKIARVLINIGCVYLEQRDFETARGFLTRGLDTCTTQGDDIGECVAALNLTELYLSTGQREEALEMGRLSLERASTLRGPMWRLQGLVLLSQIKRELGEFDDAEDAAREALELATTHDLVREQGLSLHALSSALLARGDLDGSRRHAEQLITFALDLGNQHLEQQGREVLVAVLEQQGLYLEALSELKTLRALDQLISQSTRREQIAHLEVLHATREREAEARALRDYATTLEREVLERTAELAEQNDELRKARDIAQAATRAKDTFLAIASHELRTPLNAIFGYSEMVHERLVDECTLDFDQEIEDLESIKRAGSHLLSLISKLLELSALASDHAILNVAQIDLQQLTSKIFATHVELAEQQGNISAIHDHHEPLILTTDVTRLTQALDCLIENAHRFTLGGLVEVSFMHKEGGAIIAIKDTGEGIEPAHLERLFEPFEQRDLSSTRVVDGLGLGLALARHQLEAIGAKLSIESERGEGSCVTVIVPDLGPVASSVAMQDAALGE